MGYKRYRTAKPCPGCGETFFSDGKTLCRQCAEDVSRVRYDRERSAIAKIDGTRKYVCAGLEFMNRDWSIKQPIPDPTFDQDAKNQVRYAIAELLDLMQAEKYYGKAIERIGKRDDEAIYDYDLVGSAPAKKIEAMRLLADYMQRCCTYEYWDGYRDGQRWLSKLASGELSMDEINKKQV